MPPGKDLIGSHVRYNIALNNTDTVVLGSNPRRVGLVISSPSVGSITVRFGDTTADLSDIQITSGSLPWCVTIDDIGTLIQQSVHIVAHQVSTKGGIIEASTP